MMRFTINSRVDLDLEPAIVEAQPAIFRAALWHDGDTRNLRSDGSQDRDGVNVAARDIEAGEELTINDAFVEGWRPKQAFKRTRATYRKS